jgi:hypothetical protein
MRGVTIAIFILCLSVFGTFMASGMNEAFGAGQDTGLSGPSDKVTGQFEGNQNVNDQGGGGGLLGYATYALRTLGNFSRLFTSIAEVGLALSGGRFRAFWIGLQSVVNIIGTLMLVWMARGVIGE